MIEFIFALNGGFATLFFLSKILCKYDLDFLANVNGLRSTRNTIARKCMKYSGQNVVYFVVGLKVLRLFELSVAIELK